MKPVRNILILVIVIGLLAGGFYFVTKFEPATDETATPTMAPSLIVSKIDREAITEIKVTLPEDTYTLLKDGDKWIANQDSSIKLLSSKVSTVLYDYATISAREIVEENPQDLSIYGLDYPVRKASVTTADGNVTTVLIGATSIDGSISYLMLEGDSKVYVKNASSCNSLVLPLSELVDPSVYSINSEDIGGITLSRPDTEFVKLVRVLLPKENEDDEDVYQWNMEAPLVKQANEYNINEQMIEKISSVKAVEVIPSPAEGTDYGLEAPKAEFSIWNSDGTETYTVYVGNQLKENTYIQLKGVNTIYLVATESISFINLSYQQLTDTLIHIENITEVSEININGLGKSYHLTIDGPKDSATYMINGKNIEEKAFKKAYQTVIGFSLMSFTKEPVNGTPVLTIEYKRTDGTVNKVECVDYDERNYVVLVNGSGNQVIRKKQVETMITQLDKTIAE